jgi:hypothetical protein
MVAALLEGSKTTQGPAIRHPLNGGIGHNRSDSVSEILKRVAVFLGFKAKDAVLVSGHSIRVGATQAPLALSNRIPMRY